MHNQRGRQLRRCQAITLNGYGGQCRNFSKIGSNLCSLHLAADNREYPDEATKIFNKVVSKKNRIGQKKTHSLRCRCQAYPFAHSAGGGRFCRWPYQPTQRLECGPNEEAQSLRRKLRRNGIVVNTVKELMVRGIGEDSKIIDLDCDPSDLSMEADYLSQIKYEADVLSLPIDERRQVQKKKLIAEYLLKTGKATIDDSDGARKADYDDGDALVLDEDMVEIEGEIYRL
jgi:hypothetical protein